MYLSYNELVDKYVKRQISVDIEELEQEGFIKSFINEVERLSPTHHPFGNHQIQYGFYKKKPCYRYLSLLSYPNGFSTYPSVNSFPLSPLGHLTIEDVPPVDMESLLAE